MNGLPADLPEASADKRRYITLDGLRGVAALMVVLFHTGGGRLGHWSPRFGYLAVDLFFLLSGFVLAKAYEPRFRRGMSTAGFMIARTLRLYPLYLLGLILGAAFAGLNTDLRDLTTAGYVIVLCMGLVALPSNVHQHGASFIFAFNPPLWSLFFEFWVANLAFVLFRRYLSWRVLGATVLFCAVALVVSEKRFDTESVGFDWQTFPLGFLRVTCFFFYGVALARLHALKPLKLQLPSWLFLVMLPPLLAVPIWGPLAHRYELFCVFFLFPVILYGAASAAEHMPRLSTLLGDSSYAIYVIHYPLSVLAVWAAGRLHIAPCYALEFLFLGLVAAFSWGASILDLRVRAILSSRTRGARRSSDEAAGLSSTERLQQQR